MIEYKKAIKLPFDDFKTLIILAIIGMIPIVNFIVPGFGLKCAKAVMGKKKPNFKLPKLNKFGNLFVMGFVVFLINIIYLLPALIFLLIGLYFAIINYAYLNAIVMFLISIILFALAIYLVPMAALSYADKKQIKSAFLIKKVINRTINKDYFIAWVLLLLYGIVVYIVLSVIIGIPIFALLMMGLAASSIGGSEALLVFSFGIAFVLRMIMLGLFVYIINVTYYTVFGQVYKR